MADARRSYRAAGVDVAAGEHAVELMAAAVASTRRPEVVTGLGGFGAAVALPAGMRDPLLVSSTDGVGTKTAIASAVNRFDTIGIDLVAMCADDVVCSGAAPLFFLDYVAVGQLVPEAVAELVTSVARGCLLAGCSLVGGETAEHPGLMPAEAFDLAGCCVGVVERDELIEPANVVDGDAILGLAASGLHANGFSLVRALVEQWELDLSRPYREQLRRSLGDAEGEAAIELEPQHAFATLGEVLLAPTRIYAPAILHLRASLREAGSDLHGIAHITGGGLPGNVPRALPDGLGARLDPSRWPMPSVMRLLAALGGLDAHEIRSIFNGGIGIAVVLPSASVQQAIALLDGSGIEAWPVGEVATVEALGGRYVEAKLEGSLR